MLAAPDLTSTPASNPTAASNPTPASNPPSAPNPTSAPHPTSASASPCRSDTVLPCWTTDPDLWFAESPQSVEDAKALCVPCPLREACLAGALDRREPWGVWGGQLVVHGVVVPRKRPRGRPRKVDLAA